MQAGDHLVTPRTGYTHHGLYVGDGKVIHYAGLADGLSRGAIELCSLDEFRAGCPVRVREHLLRVYDRGESVERAYSRLGENLYSVFLNNCEHFVTWCIQGLHSSRQVNTAAAALLGTRSLATSATPASGKAVAQALFGSKEACTTVAKMAAASSGGTTAGLLGSGTAKSLAATSAGTVSGLVAGGAASGAASSGAVAVAGLAGVTTASAALPLVISAGVGLAIGYGIKRLFDWF